MTITLERFENSVKIHADTDEAKELFSLLTNKTFNLTINVGAVESHKEDYVFKLDTATNELSVDLTLNEVSS